MREWLVPVAFFTALAVSAAGGIMLVNWLIRQDQAWRKAVSDVEA